MASIDVRKEEDVVDTIVFGDYGDVLQIVKTSNYVMFKDTCDDYVLVEKRDIPNLIKALQKAVELGWTK